VSELAQPLFFLVDDLTELAEINVRIHIPWAASGSNKIRRCDCPGVVHHYCRNLFSFALLSRFQESFSSLDILQF
jgi:hypothetical protein